MSTLAAERPAGAGAPAARSGRLTRRALGLLAGAAVILVLCGLSLAVGTRTIPPAEVWSAVTAYDPADTDHLVVIELRLPRTLLGLLVGAALGLSGAVMQGVTRNPLADPGILGVNAGAALFVVVGHLRLRRRLDPRLRLVRLRRRRRGRRPGLRRRRRSAGRARPRSSSPSPGPPSVPRSPPSPPRSCCWTRPTFDAVPVLAGRRAGRPRPGHRRPDRCPSCSSAARSSLLLGRSLNTLALGDDVARGLGATCVLARGASRRVAVVLLCGAATAACGPIGFVGLTVPHVARLITGPDYRWILPYAMLLGADPAAGRRRDRPGDRPARARSRSRVVTALLGAPVFIALVRRQKLAEL